jgi:hypothetical protein
MIEDLIVIPRYRPSMGCDRQFVLARRSDDMPIAIVGSTREGFTMTHEAVEVEINANTLRRYNADILIGMIQTPREDGTLWAVLFQPEDYDRALTIGELVTVH